MNVSERIGAEKRRRLQIVASRAVLLIALTLCGNAAATAQVTSPVSAAYGPRLSTYSPSPYPASPYSAPLNRAAANPAPPLHRLPPPQSEPISQIDPWAPSATGVNSYVAPAAYPTKVGDELVDEYAFQPPRRKIGGPRKGFFQKARLSGGWVAGDPISDFGLADLDANITVGLPFPRRETPLIITPGFQAWSLEGPTATDMPSRVYSSYIKFRTLRKLSERWGMDAAITPGWYSDWEASSRDKALRITGHAAVAYECWENVQLVFGVAYLDRDDINWVPMPGLIWKIDEDTRLDLILPRPRFSRRFYCDECQEYWWYIGGEMAGGSWAIQRAAGYEDIANYREFRVMLGWERKVCEGFGSHFEIAYGFGREIEYDSNTPDFSPQDTLVLRAGVSY